MDPVELGLPHREPFIFVDRVVEHSPGDSAICVKEFAGTETFFIGHFPGDPLVPGVILTEALAQTAGIAAATAPGRALRLSAIKSMKFLQPVRPGETVELRAKKLAGVGGLMQFAVEAHCRGELVAGGQIVLSEPPA